jgi:excinuclease ABC subunit C
MKPIGAPCATCACSWKAATQIWPSSCAPACKPRPRPSVSSRPPRCATCLATVEELDERQKMAAAKGDDVDIFACLRRAALVALNLFSICATARSWTAANFSGKIRRSSTSRSSSPRCCCRSISISNTCPSIIHVPVDFEDRAALEELLSEKRNRKVEIHTPQRGQKKAMLDLVADQRQAQFRCALPGAEAIVARPFRRRSRTP